TITDMFRIDFPFTDAHLLLTPRLGGMSRYLQVGILLLILAILLYLIVRLYRHELRLIPRRAALLLLGLRLALVLTLFLVTSMKPALARTVSETVPSKVLIAVDRSDSMGVPDPQRSAAEKDALVRGLRYNLTHEQIDGLTRHQIAERVLSPDGVNLMR